MSGRGDPEKGISGAQQYKLTKDIFAEHGINSTRVTHGGRHAGALEAESLGVPLDVIKKGGDWKDRLGRLETHYLGKLPSQFARGMAGFWDKPFRLPRNNVSPSLKLQKMVFPWIEDCYGTDNDPWKKFCEHEMYERDENDDDSDDGDCENVEFVEQDGIQHQHSKNERSKAPSSLQRGADTAKRGFLRLLVRCRRIILQDAAVFLYVKRENAVVNSKRRHGENNLFLSPEFKEFQEQVIASLNNPSTNRLQDYEELVPHIVDSQVEVANRLGEISNKLDKSNDRITGVQDSFDQQQQSSSRLESVILGMGQQVQHMVRNQQLLFTNQCYLGSQVQSLMASNMSIDGSDFAPASSSSFSPIINPPAPPALPPVPASPSPQVHISPSPHQRTFINNNNDNTRSSSPSHKGEKKG